MQKNLFNLPRTKETRTAAAAPHYSLNCFKSSTVQSPVIIDFFNFPILALAWILPYQFPFVCSSSDLLWLNSWRSGDEYHDEGSSCKPGQKFPFKLSSCNKTGEFSSFKSDFGGKFCCQQLLFIGHIIFWSFFSCFIPLSVVKLQFGRRAWVEFLADRFSVCSFVARPLIPESFRAINFTFDGKWEDATVKKVADEA